MTESRFRAGLLRRSLSIAACTALLAAGIAHSADHADSPSLNAEAETNPADPSVRQADINDIYAFMNETEAGRAGELILIMTVVPDATTSDTFSQTVSYNFLIENAAGTHHRIRCTFPTSTDQFSCALGDTVVVEGAVGDENVPAVDATAGGSMRVFAGLRDDPFFFNGPGLSQTFAAFAAGGTAPDALMFEEAAAPNGENANSEFGGEDILGIVIGIDRSLLISSETEGLLRIWAATESM